MKEYYSNGEESCQVQASTVGNIAVRQMIATCHSMDSVRKPFEINFSTSERFAGTSDHKNIPFQMLPGEYLEWFQIFNKIHADFAFNIDGLKNIPFNEKGLGGFGKKYYVGEEIALERALDEETNPAARDYLLRNFYEEGFDKDNCIRTMGGLIHSIQGKWTSKDQDYGVIAPSELKGFENMGILTLSQRIEQFNEKQG